MGLNMVPPRRLVRKAFDGNALVNAFVLSQTGSAEATRKVNDAEYLLSRGICPPDVSKMMGMPLTNVRKLAGNIWSERRVGRLPSSIGQLLMRPEGHLRASVFVNYVMTISELKGEPVISGETYASAMRSMDVLCGDFGVEDCPQRYLMLAVDVVVKGECELSSCGQCRTRYLRSFNGMKIQKGCFSRGECPFCKYMKSRQNANRRLNGQVAKKTNAFNLESAVEETTEDEMFSA